MILTYATLISAFRAILHPVSLSYVHGKLGCSVGRQEAETTSAFLHSSNGPGLLQQTPADNTVSSFSARCLPPWDMGLMPGTFQEPQKIPHAMTEHLPSPHEFPSNAERLGFGDWYVDENEFSALVKDPAPLALSSTEEVARYYDEFGFLDQVAIKSIALPSNIASGVDSQQFLAEDAARGSARSPTYHHAHSPALRASPSGGHDWVGTYSALDTERVMATPIIENQQDQSYSTYTQIDLQNHPKPFNYALRPTDEDESQPSPKKSRLGGDTQPQSYREQALGTHMSHCSFEPIGINRGIVNEKIQQEVPLLSSCGQSVHEQRWDNKTHSTRQHLQNGLLDLPMMPQGLDNCKTNLQSTVASVHIRADDVSRETIKDSKQVGFSDIHHDSSQKQVPFIGDKSFDGVYQERNHGVYIGSFQRFPFLKEGSSLSPLESFKDCMCFSLENNDPLALPFISTLSKTLSTIERRQMRVIHEKFIHFLKKAYGEMVNTIHSRKNLPSEIESNHSFGEIGELYQAVWCMNKRILEIFGSKHDENENQAEHVALMKWLILQVLGDEGVSPVVAPTTESFNSSNEIQFITLKDLIKNFLGSGGYEYIWKVPSEFSIQEVKISKRDVLITEIAIYIVGSYYKRTNIEKWCYFFQIENDFLRLLSDIQMRIIGKSYGRFVKNRPKICKSLGIIPWKQGWDPNLPSLQILKHSIASESSKRTPSWIEPIIRFKTSRELELMYSLWEDELLLNLDNLDVKIYSWIMTILDVMKECSLIPLQAHVDPAGRFEQYILNEIILPNFGMAETYLKNNEGLLQIMTDLSTTLFYLNRAFIGVFLFDDMKDVLDKEEENIKCWFLNLLTTSKEIIELSNICWNFPSINFKGIRNLRELVMSLLRNPLKNSVLKLNFEGISPKNSVFKPNFEGISSESIYVDSRRATLTYLAVIIIGTYYKTRNIKKWETLFAKDDKFLQIFVRINKSYLPNISITQRPHQDVFLKTLGVFPWDGIWFPTESQRKKLRSCFRSGETRLMISVFKPSGNDLSGMNE